MEAPPTSLEIDKDILSLLYLIHFIKIFKISSIASSIISIFLLCDLNLHFSNEIFNNLKFNYLGSSAS